MPSCLCVNDSTRTACKGYVKKGEVLCARHRAKPCEELIIDKQELEVIEPKVIKKETRKKKYDREKKQVKEEPKKETRKMKYDREQKEKPEVQKKETRKKQEKTMIIVVPKEKHPESILLSDKNYKQCITRMTTWRSIMNEGYKFPEWVIPKLKASQLTFNNYMNRARVYINHPFHLETAIRLVKEREPVNIERSQLFDKRKLQSKFGWDTGYYDRHFKNTNELAPNIAIYTPTLFFPPIDEERKSIPEYIEILVLNVIGLAFDNKKQVDYQYFSRINFDPKKVYTHYLSVFQKIFHCAKDNHLTVVAIPPFGLGFFAKLYPNKKDLLLIFAHTMKQTSQSLKCSIQLMGFLPKMKQTIIDVVGTHMFGPDLGYFPQNVAQISDLKTTLFVNAWDTLSGPGNGCAGDDSLDGAMGSTTMIAVTGNGALNPFLLEPDRYISI